MAIKVPMVKHLGALRPAGPDAEAALEKIPHGREVMVEIKQPRNIKHHRMWWALCNLIADNQEKYKDANEVHAILKIASGHCTTITMSNGNMAYIPKSISFTGMDQTEFALMFDDAVAYCCRRVIPEMDPGALRTEIEEICGLHPVAA